MAQPAGSPQDADAVRYIKSRLAQHGRELGVVPGCDQVFHIDRGDLGYAVLLDEPGDGLQRLTKVNVVNAHTQDGHAGAHQSGLSALS